MLAEPDAWLRPGWRARDLTVALADYRARGFAVLREVVSEPGLAALRERAEALMLGRCDASPFFFQHEPDHLGRGYGRWTGPSLGYRKIEKLERDATCAAFIANPLFERLARAVVAPDGAGVVLYRAIFMNKPPRSTCGGGSTLPWHQDGGLLWGLSRDPELQLWTALDDAPLDAGCLTVAPGTHALGLASPLGGLVPEAVAAHTPIASELVPVRAGDVVLLHNLLWHGSGINQTDRARRALSLCMMHASVRCRRTRRAPRVFPALFPPA